jgi:L-threonylcarbamoyladenylate synthase
VIVHLPDATWLDAWASDVPPEARRLAERFWPGPLTLILRRRESVPNVVTGGQDTVGLRVPGHPVALALLRESDVPIAAPSANRFGRVSATTAAHVVQDFGDSIDAVIDGGPCPVGLESTIVDLSGEAPRILRLGAIEASALETVLGARLRPPNDVAPRVPGALDTHYSPVTQLRLVEAARLLDTVARENGVLCVLARMPRPEGGDVAHWIEMPEDAVDYARVLYDSLRRADREGADLILVERPPTGAEWAAVHDRLRRASHVLEPAP